MQENHRNTDARVGHMYKLKSEQRPRQAKNRGQGHKAEEQINDF